MIERVEKVKISTEHRPQNHVTPIPRGGRGGKGEEEQYQQLEIPEIVNLWECDQTALLNFLTEK